MWEMFFFWKCSSLPLLDTIRGARSRMVYFTKAFGWSFWVNVTLRATSSVCKQLLYLNMYTVHHPDPNTTVTTHPQVKLQITWVVANEDSEWYVTEPLVQITSLDESHLQVQHRYRMLLLSHARSRFVWITYLYSLSFDVGQLSKAVNVIHKREGRREH